MKTITKKSARNTTKSGNVPFEVGKKYFFRTVTYFMTGEVADIKGNFLVIKKAAWIADTGRFSTALSTGEFEEVEPVAVTAYLNTNTVVDAFDWPFDLPNKLK
jgi:hypothetical protein